MKQYIGISRDHSASMRGIGPAAMDDYNQNIAAIKTASVREDIDTIVSVVECGAGIRGEVRRAVVNSGVSMLKKLTTYVTDGSGTPLFDSVLELISILEKVPDAEDRDVSFLVMAITDGGENASKPGAANRLRDKLLELQGTDRWTFVFRVPFGNKASLTRLGIPAGNIQEWDGVSEKSIRETSVITTRSVSNYFTARSTGVRGTDKFYADLAGVSPKQVKGSMTNISGEVRIFPVGRFNDGDQIRDFVQSKTGYAMPLGSAFYQLSKLEKAVQSYKLIVIRDLNSGAVYAGQSARDLLNLPTQGTISLTPGNHGNYDIYIQSTSVNRKLVGGTNVLYWENATRSR